LAHKTFASIAIEISGVENCWF